MAPPPRAAPKLRTNPKITGAETNQEEPGRIPRTHLDCAFVRPPARPHSPRPLLLPEAAARKRTKERGIKEGRESKEAHAHIQYAYTA